MTLQFPPIRPSRLTRLANRLGCRRAELVAALWAIAVGSPVAVTAVILWTVPVPQTMSVPFDPAQPSAVIATSSAAEPPSPPHEPARTRAAAPPRVSVAPAPERASATRTAARAATFASCAEAASAGRQDIPRGDPAYRAALDRDGDGTACESTSEVEPSGPSTPDPTEEPAPTTERSTLPTTEAGAALIPDIPS